VIDPALVRDLLPFDLVFRGYFVRPGRPVELGDEFMAAINPSPIGSPTPVSSVTTADLASVSSNVSPTSGPALYSTGIPEPAGIEPSEEQRAEEGQNTDPTAGTGVEGEVVVWEARYSIRNFMGRMIARAALTVAWMVLAVYTWGLGYSNLEIVTWIALGVVVVLWLWLGVRMIQAHYSHFYRLTNRRLFVSTGIVSRRRDMLELLRIKDVYTRQQSLLERWLGLGTVVVVPGEKELPTFFVAGVADPKEVMDLIWHHTRAERDLRSVKIDNL
jgi:membrane protein YdbS with pleckstrin-like domain